VALVHKFLFLGEMSKFYFFYQIELLKENEKKKSETIWKYFGILFFLDLKSSKKKIFF